MHLVRKYNNGIDSTEDRMHQVYMIFVVSLVLGISWV